MRPLRLGAWWLSDRGPTAPANNAKEYLVREGIALHERSLGIQIDL